MFRHIAASLAKAPTRALPRTFASLARPFTLPAARSTSPLVAASRPALGIAGGARANAGPVSIFDIVNQQRRFKSRGNTYQPNMLKRKRRAGFLARLRTRGGRKILERRRAKGRWFLTY